jgi:hypothetical protein
MTLVPPKNSNYAATVVSVKEGSLIPLPNCENVQHCLILGSLVIVSTDTRVDDVGLFFPVECALSEEFLSNNNLYRSKVSQDYPSKGNVDPSKSGFFEQHGRVKCMRFRGHKSEGFFIPMNSLLYILGDLQQGQALTLKEGDTFDTLGDHEICRKYVPKGNRGQSNTQTKGRQPSLEDSIKEGQFRFHSDTTNLRRNIHKLNPDDYISVTDKFHGTSVVSGRLAVKRNLNWFEKLLKRFGVQILEDTYGLVYSSRRVIKGVNGVAKGGSNHYYTSDIWGAVAKELDEKIPDGFTLYGEIVGYTSDGSPIQGGYHYGCAVGQHKYLVYRITTTNASGRVIELSWLQLLEFAKKYGIEPVPTLYYGKARDLFPELDTEHHWHDAFLASLEKKFVYDQDCPYNDRGTPAEGVVLRIDRLEEAESFKLKCFRFLEQESKSLDKGTLDIETQEAEVV